MVTGGVSVDGSLWPLPAVLGSCGGGREEVLRSGPLLLASDKGGGCCLAPPSTSPPTILEDCSDVQGCVQV